MAMLPNSQNTSCRQLTLFAEAIPVPDIVARVQQQPVVAPICPDTSLPWSEDCGPGGWSAKTFLHQLLSTSTRHWQPSDTEQLLSDWIPHRRHANPEREISLSDVLERPGQSSERCFPTPKAVRGLAASRLATQQVVACLTTRRQRYDSRDNYVYESAGFRILGSEERERFGGFPTGWTTGFSETTRAMMMGNAIVPQVAQFIGEHIMEVEESNEIC